MQQGGYLLQDQQVSCIQAGKDDFSVIMPDHEKDWQYLQQKVYLRKTGLNLGTPSGKDWLPSHDVALSINAASDIPFIDVSKEQALRFLKREDMALQNTDKGWKVVRYNGLGLGWIKALGNRVNNYLPKHWRIRMDLGSFTDE
jgi:NOL1/NOP2/fmu family ribosome biogenesis protein